MGVPLGFSVGVALGLAVGVWVGVSVGMLLRLCIAVPVGLSVGARVGDAPGRLVHVAPEDRPDGAVVQTGAGQGAVDVAVVRVRAPDEIGVGEAPGGAGALPVAAGRPGA